nr:hypothetical protein [Actinomycetota bacterium]
RYVIVPAGRRQEDTDPISAILDPVMEALEGERERHDTPPQVLELAEAAGFDVVGVERAPRHDYEDTPDEIARMVEQRAYSVLWDVPDDKWAEIVMPAVGALRSLPHPDLPLPRSSLTDLIVLERR